MSSSLLWKNNTEEKNSDNNPLHIIIECINCIRRMNPDGTIDRTNKNECNLVKFSCTLNVRGAKIISICRKSCFFAKKERENAISIQPRSAMQPNQRKNSSALRISWPKVGKYKIQIIKRTERNSNGEFDVCWCVCRRLEIVTCCIQL